MLFSHSVMSDSLWPHGLQHARLPRPSQSPGACSNSCPLNQWCHPAISSSVIPCFPCLQFFPASRSFPMRWPFTFIFDFLIRGKLLYIVVLVSVVQRWETVVITYTHTHTHTHTHTRIYFPSLLSFFFPPKKYLRLLLRGSVTNSLLRETQWFFLSLVNVFPTHFYPGEHPGCLCVYLGRSEVNQVHF